MRVKKLVASILSVSVLTIYPFISANANPSINNVSFAEEVRTIGTPLKYTSYLSFSGTVKGIEVTKPTEGSETLRYIFVENEEGQVAYFVVTEDTFILNEDQLEEGAKIIGFYDASKPMIMIYPPQYPVEVIAVNQAENIKVDIFDQDLVSVDGMLKLTLTPQTEVVSQDGTTYQGKLGNQKLVVVFKTTTKSIPAQTNPTKVIVLAGDNSETTEEPKPTLNNLLAEQLELLIGDQKFSVPSAYVNNKGTLMLPLRVVVERLNQKLTWDKALEQVVVNDQITLTIGQDRYLTADGRVINLGAPPELKDGRTFVPLDFFVKVLGETVYLAK